MLHVFITDKTAIQDLAFGSVFAKSIQALGW
jgi:hypothetical protein